MKIYVPLPLRCIYCAATDNGRGLVRACVCACPVAVYTRSNTDGVAATSSTVYLIH